VNIKLRQLARRDPNVFHFVGQLLGLRCTACGWSSVRELSRLWYHEHPASAACRARASGGDPDED
jgi:hypothetical protein